MKTEWGWRPENWETLYQQARKEAYERLNSSDRPSSGEDVDRVLIETGAKLMLNTLREYPRDQLEEWTGFAHIERGGTYA